MNSEVVDGRISVYIFDGILERCVNNLSKNDKLSVLLNTATERALMGELKMGGKSEIRSLTDIRVELKLYGCTLTLKKLTIRDKTLIILSLTKEVMIVICWKRVQKQKRNV